MAPSQDKRSNPRIGLKVFVDEEQSRTGAGLCRAVNVSRTGMYLLRVPGREDQSARFAWLGFRLPDGGRSIRALVEVVHRRRVGSLEASGVRFKHLFPGDRQRLDEFLDDVSEIEAA